MMRTPDGPITVYKGQVVAIGFDDRASMSPRRGRRFVCRR